VRLSTNYHDCHKRTRSACFCIKVAHNRSKLWPCVNNKETHTYTHIRFYMHKICLLLCFFRTISQKPMQLLELLLLLSAMSSVVQRERKCSSACLFSSQTLRKNNTVVIYVDDSGVGRVFSGVYVCTSSPFLRLRRSITLRAYDARSVAILGALIRNLRLVFKSYLILRKIDV